MKVEFNATVRDNSTKMTKCGRITNVKLFDLVGKKVKVIIITGDKKVIGEK